MKLVSVLLGQAIRLMTTSVPGGGLYMPEAVGALRERYGFVDIPTTLQDFDPTKGVTFRHGRFLVGRSHVVEESAPREILIDQFQVFAAGVRVDTRVHVEFAEMFIDDVLTWATESFGLKILREHPVVNFYLSQVEVKSDVGFGTLFSLLDPLNKIITAIIRDYGYEKHEILYPAFGLSGLILNIDLTKVRFPLLSPFGFERRAQQPYDSNLYYSAAPLKTLDHLRVLGELERIAARTPADVSGQERSS
jgi:hypothetical protein